MIAFIFSGQGNEYSCMAKELYENNSYAKDFIDNLKLNFDFKKIFIFESDKIHDTRYSQIGNFVLNFILAKMIEKNNIKADVCAGLSLGEYNALCYANVIDYKNAISILEKRSELMYEALISKNTGMYAIMFFDLEIICQIIKKYDGVYITNYNSPDQIVIAGDNDKLNNCVKECIDRGAKKVVKLDVIGAFHCELLKNASKKFSNFLNKYNFYKNNIPIYFNYTGNKSNDNITQLLVKQMYNPVLFEKIIKNMISDGVDEIYAIGLGNSIKNFIRSICIHYKYKINIFHIEKMKDLEIFKK